MPVDEQVVSIFAGTRGYLDDLDVSQVRRFEAELLEFVRARYSGVLSAIRAGDSLPEDELANAVSTFKELFVANRPSADGQDRPSGDTNES
jgi:F-type H+-transporting ATPase subunit alpha